MAEFAVVAFAPGEDSAVSGKGQGVSPAGMDGHFADDVVRQCRHLTRRARVVRMAQPQAAVAAFTTSVHLFQSSFIQLVIRLSTGTQIISQSPPPPK